MSPLPKPWKDVSSFSKSDKDHTPRTWHARFGVFGLVLTRHIHYAADAWIASCPEVFAAKVMDSKEVHEAAAQAVGLLQCKLEEALGAILDGKS